ncbi:MAG: hypothetical protein ACRDZ4_11760 [Egibacteraceae bacterium]
MRVWHLGALGTPDDAERIVSGFRAAVPGAVALVVPATEPIPGPDEASSVLVADTLWGSLMGARAECRWRVEGARCAVSVVSEVALDGLDLAAEDAETGELHRLVWHPGALSGLPQGATPYSVTYRLDGGQVLTRTGVT